LTIRNAAGNSFTVNPTTPNNTATFLNPIATSLGVSAGTLTVATSGTINGSNIATEGRANVYTGTNNFNGNLNGATTSAQGLTISRNNETGYNELDLISLNATTTTGLNIYAETTSVNTASTPKLTIYNDTTPTLLNTSLNICTGGANSAILSTSASGLSVDDSITATGSLTSTTGYLYLAGNSLTSGGGAINVNSSTFGIINSSLGNIGVSLACPAINYLQIGSGNGGLNCGPISGSQLTLTNGANTTALTTSGAGLNIADPTTITGLLTSGGINNGNNSLISGGIGQFAYGSNGDVSTNTFSNVGLYFAKNGAGQSEYDIIAVNTKAGATSILNIYTEPTQFQGGVSQPLLRLTDNNAYLNGSAIATIAGAYKTQTFTTPSYPVFTYTTSQYTGTNTASFFSTDATLFVGTSAKLTVVINLLNGLYPASATNVLVSSGNAYLYSTAGQAIGMSIGVSGPQTIALNSNSSPVNTQNWYLAFNFQISWTN
jgi:hypothetical protein